jgi:hypothetical protein
MMEYLHLLDEDAAEVRGGGGSYSGEEKRIQYKGREVLLVVGGTSAVTACCGVGRGTAFITVPGFVKAWRYRTDEAGLPVSRVESVAEEERADLKSALEQEYGIGNIRFL